MYKVWIFSANAKGFIQHSLLDHFEQMELEVISVQADPKFYGAETAKPDSVIIVADDDILENHEALVFIRDLIVQERIPVFLLGDKTPIEKISNSFDPVFIKERFPRPVDVKEVVKTVDAYLAFAGRNV